MDEEKTVNESTTEDTAVENDAPAEQTAETEAPAPKQRRKRRTKAEIEADAAKAAAKAKRGARKAVKAAEEAAKDAVEDGVKAVEKISRPRIPTPDIFVQYSGDEVNTAALVDAAIVQFRAVKKRARITDLKLYIKPEEKAAYYVINGEFSGKVDF